MLSPLCRSEAEKSEYGRLFKIMTSDAIFKILPGEHEALKRHAAIYGCKDTTRLRRKYWRLRGSGLLR